MNIKYFSLFFYITFPLVGMAQSAYQPVRDGNEAYKENDYLSAEEFYRKSIRKDASLREAAFNLGNALYRQEKFEDAARYYSQAADKSADKKLKSEAFHNLGNAHLKNQKLEEAISAYKNALINDPKNEESRYNLAYALKQQQEQQEQEEKEEENKEEQEQEDNQEEQNKDEQQENQEEEQEQDQQQEEEQQEEQKEEEQQQQQQQQEQQLSREDAERILEALNNKEKEIQEDLKKKKTKEVDINIEKDW